MNALSLFGSASVGYGKGDVARYQAGIRTERRIIEATRELLGEVGLEGTTLKAICDRAEVRSG
ncbi:MAG: TetR family transcriptional regulator, partial [Acidimicrobiia bacterium]